MNVVVERIEAFRKKIKITQTELSLKLGKSYNVIPDWKRGQSSPNISDIEFLHNEYGVNILWLITGKGTMFQSEPLIEEHKYEKKSDVPHWTDIVAKLVTSNGSLISEITRLTNMLETQQKTIINFLSKGKSSSDTH